MTESVQKKVAVRRLETLVLSSRLKNTKCAPPQRLATIVHTIVFVGRQPVRWFRSCHRSTCLWETSPGLAVGTVLAVGALLAAVDAVFDLSC